MKNGEMLGCSLHGPGGLVIGIFVMLGDELINFAQCCSGEKYPFPLIGSFSIWDSWVVMFTMVLLGSFLSITGTAIFYHSMNLSRVSTRIQESYRAF